jgi:hypothetical protein
VEREGASSRLAARSLLARAPCHMRRVRAVLSSQPRTIQFCRRARLLPSCQLPAPAGYAAGRQRERSGSAIGSGRQDGQGDAKAATGSALLESRMRGSLTQGRLNFVGLNRCARFCPAGPDHSGGGGRGGPVKLYGSSFQPGDRPFTHSQLLIARGHTQP